MGKTYKDTANFYKRKGRKKPSKKVKEKVDLLELDPNIGLRCGNNRNYVKNKKPIARRQQRMAEKEETRRECIDSL